MRHITRITLLALVAFALTACDTTNPAPPQPGHAVRSVFGPVTLYVNGNQMDSFYRAEITIDLSRPAAQDRHITVHLIAPDGETVGEPWTETLHEHHTSHTFIATFNEPPRPGEHELVITLDDQEIARHQHDTSDLAAPWSDPPELRIDFTAEDIFVRFDGLNAGWARVLLQNLDNGQYFDLGLNDPGDAFGFPIDPGTVTSDTPFVLIFLASEKHLTLTKALTTRYLLINHNPIYPTEAF